MYKTKKFIVPGSHTLLPIVALILQKFGGKATKNQIVLSVMSYCDLPFEAYKKAKRNRMGRNIFKENRFPIG